MQRASICVNMDIFSWHISYVRISKDTFFESKLIKWMNKFASFCVIAVLACIITDSTHMRLPCSTRQSSTRCVLQVLWQLFNWQNFKPNFQISIYHLDELPQSSKYPAPAELLSSPSFTWFLHRCHASNVKSASCTARHGIGLSVSFDMERAMRMHMSVPPAVFHTVADADTTDRQ